MVIAGRSLSNGSMKLQGKKILVTGADGFIGSYLSEYLVEQAAKMRAFVRDMLNAVQALHNPNFV